MSIAYDAYTYIGNFLSGSVSNTHTPTGTPRGVFVFIVQYDDTDTPEDEVAEVSYGGVELMEVENISPMYMDAGSEKATLYVYFLGSGIPTGTQTVLVTAKTVTTYNTKHVVCVTATAASDLGIEDENYSDIAVTDGTPELPLTIGGGRECFVIGLCNSGANKTQDIGPGSGMTAVYKRDLGNQVFQLLYRTTNPTSNTTLDWTLAAGEEEGIVGLAVYELPIEFFGVSVNPADQGELSATTVTITPPSGMQAGDLVYMLGVFRSDVDYTMYISQGGGQSWYSGGGGLRGWGCHIERFWCVFDGTWSANPVIDSGAPSAAEITGAMVVFRRVGTSDTWTKGTDGTQFTTSDGNNDLVYAPSDQSYSKGILVMTHNRDVTHTIWWHTPDWRTPGSDQYRNMSDNDLMLTIGFYIFGQDPTLQTAKARTDSGPSYCGSTFTWFYLQPSGTTTSFVAWLDGDI